MFHTVDSCPLSKLNGGLSQLHSADDKRCYLADQLQLLMYSQEEEEEAQHLTPSSHRVHIWYGKTRMAGLQSAEGRMMIDSVAWAQYINTTDTQTAMPHCDSNSRPNTLHSDVKNCYPNWIFRSVKSATYYSQAKTVEFSDCAVLISTSIAISQTPAHTARTWIQRLVLAHCVMWLFTPQPSNTAYCLMEKVTCPKLLCTELKQWPTDHRPD